MKLSLRLGSEKLVKLRNVICIFCQVLAWFFWKLFLFGTHIKTANDNVLPITWILDLNSRLGQKTIIYQNQMNWVKFCIFYQVKSQDGSYLAKTKRQSPKPKKCGGNWIIFALDQKIWDLCFTLKSKMHLCGNTFSLVGLIVLPKRNCDQKSLCCVIWLFLEIACLNFFDGTLLFFKLIKRLGLESTLLNLIDILVASLCCK